MFLDTPSLLATRLTLPPVSPQLRCIIIHVSALTGDPTQCGQGCNPSSVKALKAKVKRDFAVPAGEAWMKFPVDRCCVYSNEVLV